jgi:hypothetical protein
MTESTGSYEVKLKTTYGSTGVDALPVKPLKPKSEGKFDGKKDK